MIYGWLIKWLTLLSGDWLTDWMIFGRLIDWITDSTVWGLANQLNDFWLIDSLSNWPYCPRTDQLTEWFMANWIVLELAKWLNDFWLIELSRGWPSDWIIYGWLIDWLTDSTVWGLANWLNDFWLIYWLSNWLYCPGTDHPTEWFLADLLTE